MFLCVFPVWTPVLHQCLLDNPAKNVYVPCCFGAVAVPKVRERDAVKLLNSGRKNIHTGKNQLRSRWCCEVYQCFLLLRLDLPEIIPESQWSVPTTEPHHQHTNSDWPPGFWSVHQKCEVIDPAYIYRAENRPQQPAPHQCWQGKPHFFTITFILYCHFDKNAKCDWPDGGKRVLIMLRRSQCLYFLQKSVYPLNPAWNLNPESK